MRTAADCIEDVAAIGADVDERLWSAFFFFFQAEDGIRDLYVTGVQTCALPISTLRPARSSAMCWSIHGRALPSSSMTARSCGCLPRSEERRVGKECRSRWK